MSKEFIGYCVICKKPLTRDMFEKIAEDDDFGQILYFEGWPGSGLACASHPGVKEEYLEQLRLAGHFLEGVK